MGNHGAFFICEVVRQFFGVFGQNAILFGECLFQCRQRCNSICGLCLITRKRRSGQARVVWVVIDKTLSVKDTCWDFEEIF